MHLKLRHVVAIATLFGGAAMAQSSYDDLQARLETRGAMYAAGTIRPAAIQVSSQSPSIARRLIAGTVYVHSGELEVSHLDLNVGGRAGGDVVISRVYRSGTLSMTGQPIGMGVGLSDLPPAVRWKMDQTRRKECDR